MVQKVSKTMPHIYTKSGSKSYVFHCMSLNNMHIAVWVYILQAELLT